MNQPSSSFVLLLASFMLFTYCGEVNTRTTPKLTTPDPDIAVQSNPQIADYIRNIYQDKNGHFWFGTNGYGVAHFDGDSVSYFSNDQGFGGQQITGIEEDPEKNIWFATDQGIVKYDGSTGKDGAKIFTNYPSPHFFEGQRFWSICADSKGNVWAGAEKGIYLFKGGIWQPFNLPYPEAFSGEFITAGTAWSIIEDSQGNIWFTSNGFGAFRYDGKTFTQISSKDGLTDDSIDIIMEDRLGHMWFGTRYGGVSRYDGKSFTYFTVRDGIIGDDEVCSILEDSNGDIWFSSEGFGVYRYNADGLTNYSEKEGLGVRAVQTIFEDTDGRLWAGGGGGLYRWEGASFVNVTKDGPWE